MHELTVQSHRGPYRVRFGAAFEGLREGLAPGRHLIIDERVAQLYHGELAAALSGPSVLRILAEERNKSLEKFPAYITHLIEQGVKRDHQLVAVGGGIIQDVVAFIAAILLRGLAWTFYPTTLLAQADSCIGSKSSVNIGPYKNQVGTFTPPEEVMISTEVLRTLSEADVRSGIGEMIKVHIIAGWEETRMIAADYPKLAKDPRVMEPTIRRSLELKKQKVEADEFDRGERLVMNYGHTFGHAIESATGYAIPHGIAVSLGMEMANFLSRRLGFLDTAVYDELHQLIATNYAGFEATPIPRERFLSALLKDKKNTSRELSVILLRGPGQVFRARYAADDRFLGLCGEFLDLLAENRIGAACLSR